MDLALPVFATFCATRADLKPDNVDRVAESCKFFSLYFYQPWGGFDGLNLSTNFAIKDE